MNNMRKLGIDYGDSRVGISITDPLGITAQGLKRLDEIMQEYEIDTFVIGIPYKLNGDSADRVEITEKFIQKLKCKFNKVKIEKIDERLTTVAAHRTMNILDINKKQKRNIVDTISAVYILEMYINKK